VDFRHLSVMPAEVLRFLSPRAGGLYLDGTLGGGGHTALILEASSPDGRVIAFDRDREAIAAATARLAPYGDRLRVVQGDFADMGRELSAMDVTAIDGFILDLGVSSHQLDTPERGFSFQQDAPLDMRMDRSAPLSAAEVVNGWREGDLERIIREYGEERFARRIAAAIVRHRLEAPVATTLQLADIVRGAIPRRFQEERIHPATRTFQAIRIAVNDELVSVERGVRGAIQLLRPGGRGVVISFHSLEDRIVKTVFRESAVSCICPKALPRCVCSVRPQVKVLTGKPVLAADDEVASNPRARSAKLRAVEKLAQ
jgi:16S rRNA (cytosine1402-N4)-methyltransferase